MRTIKFRGKDAETGEWLVGDIIQRFGYFPSILFPYNSNGKIHYSECAVDANTIGQFTGLLDKNDKEIYEGDIVKEKLKRAKKDGDILQICFDDYEWCGKNDVGASTSFYLLATYHELEVIGNIHDNPELLKGGEK